MKLKEYLDKNHMMYRYVAVDLGISETTIYAIFKGEFDPRLSFMKKVEEYTNNNVKIKDWIKELETKKENIA